MERTAQLDSFQRFLDKYGKSRIAIATHNRADVDALSSAFALSKVLPGSVVCTSEEMSEGAKMLAQKLNVTPSDLSNMEKNQFEGLLVVDTSAYTLVPAAKA